MSTPTTAAGRALPTTRAALYFLEDEVCDCTTDEAHDDMCRANNWADAIARIEAESYARALDDVTRAVEGLIEHPDCLCDALRPSPTISLAGVLAAIERLRVTP